MRVLYDYQIFHYQRFGGISKYFVELMKALHAKRLAQIRLPLQWSVNKELEQLVPLIGNINNHTSLPARLHIPIPSPIRSIYHTLFPSKDKILVHQQLLLDELQNPQNDVFHPTYYEDYYIPYLKNMPFVVTVYDMIHELFPEYYSNQTGRDLSKKKKLVIQHANKIIAISESTKNDLCRLYTIDPSKVVVIPLANSLTRLDEKNAQTTLPNLPEKYFLFAGMRHGYKNYSFLLSSMGELFQRYRDVSLVCTGTPFTHEEKALLRSLGLDKRVLHIGVTSDDVLSLLYIRAVALVFPSLYEGFGLPVLEAMACDCPVIVSNISSLPEVAGNAALYFDPRDADSIRNALYQILESRTLQSELREKGRIQEKKFTWEEVARRTTEIYSMVHNKH